LSSQTFFVSKSSTLTKIHFLFLFQIHFLFLSIAFFVSNTLLIFVRLFKTKNVSHFLSGQTFFVNVSSFLKQKMETKKASLFLSNIFCKGQVSIFVRFLLEHLQKAYLFHYFIRTSPYILFLSNFCLGFVYSLII